MELVQLDLSYPHYYHGNRPSWQPTGTKGRRRCEEEGEEGKESGSNLCFSSLENVDHTILNSREGEHSGDGRKCTSVMEDIALDTTSSRTFLPPRYTLSLLSFLSSPLPSLILLKADYNAQPSSIGRCTRRSLPRTTPIILLFKPC